MNGDHMTAMWTLLEFFFQTESLIGFQNTHLILCIAFVFHWLDQKFSTNYLPSKSSL